ncbi:hypothetical protein GVAV_000234 [Gurleya vavrai]
MQLFIKSQNNTTNSLNLKEDVTVNELRQKLSLPENSSLHFAGRILQSHNKLSVYGISNASNLTVSVRCLGGAMTETDKAALNERYNKMICRVCYATNSVRASNCRKKGCGRSSKLRPKKTKKCAKK